jgi:hypothetical protein
MKQITFLLLILCSLDVAAHSKKQDILYLKNGAIIYGVIQDSSGKSEKVKIKISGGSTLVYKAEEVDSIRQESLNKGLRREFFNTYYRKDKGFRNITEVQFTYNPVPINANYVFVDGYYGNGSLDNVGVSVHTINGYQICPNLFIGAGVGMDRMLTFRRTFIPLYMRIQTELLKKRITPYLFGDIGYAFLVADQVQGHGGYSYYHRIGGVYTTLGGGIHIYTKGPLSYMIGVGYRRNYSEQKFGEAGYYNYSYDIKNMYQSLVTSVGLTF